MASKKSDNPVGRPTVVTPESIQLLNDAFKLGCTDLEACFSAGISKSTLYNYQNENPEFLEQKELFKENPIFVARTTVVEAIKTDPELALKYLERKRKAEFSTRGEVTGANGGPQKSENKWIVEFVDADVESK